MQTSIQSLMVSLGFFLVTTLTRLTAVFSEDLISLTIKLKRMMGGAERTLQSNKYLSLCLLPKMIKTACLYLFYQLSIFRFYFKI